MMAERLSGNKKDSSSKVNTTNSDPTISKPIQISNQANLRNIIQRATVPTDFGDFKDESYEDILHKDIVKNGNNKKVGVDIKLTFDPKPGKANATKIGLVQSVKSYDQGLHRNMGDREEPLVVDKGEGAGYKIDRAYGDNNPVYGSKISRGKRGLKHTPKSDYTGRGPIRVSKKMIRRGGTGNANYKLGFCYVPRKKNPSFYKKEKAEMYDHPHMADRGKDSGQLFETTALAIDGVDKGKYYGSVSWGWTVDGGGQFKRHKLKEESGGDPTGKFKAAAEKWNVFNYSRISKPDRRGNAVVKEALDVKIRGDDVKLAPGTKLRILKNRRKTTTLFLDKTIQVRDGGAHWICYIPESSFWNVYVGNILVKDTTAMIDDKPVTLKAPAVIEPTDKIINKERLVFFKSGTLLNVPRYHRRAKAETLDIKGRDTVDLPIPG